MHCGMYVAVTSVLSGLIVNARIGHNVLSSDMIHSLPREREQDEEEPPNRQH